MRLNSCLLTAACAVGILGNAAAAPYPRSNMPPAADLGLTFPPPIPLPAGINLPVKLPAGYFGRNVPDISVNSDPQTGYLVWYTSDVNGFETPTYGGTSFAAPQLNGVTSLFNQGLHHRVGLLNFSLYAIADSNGAYSGRYAPLRDIKSGDNWYWYAKPGYDQATGVGVPNVANLLQALRGPLF